MAKTKLIQDKGALELIKLEEEIKEIKRKSSYWQTAIKYIIAGILLSAALVAWLINVYMPISDLNNQIEVKRDELRKMELNKMEIINKYQQDSLKMEINNIIKEHTNLLGIYLKLKNENKINNTDYVKYKQNNDNQIQRLNNKLKKFSRVVTNSNGDTLTDEKGNIIINEDQPLIDADGKPFIMGKSRIK